MKPKIISLSYVTPPRAYTQKEIFDGLGYNKHWFRVFEEAQIDKRHFLFPIEEIKKLSFQEQQEEYAEWAYQLSYDALLKTINGYDRDRIGLLSYSSCTGFAPGPTIGHRLADTLQLKDVEISNLSGLGCESSFPGLRRCYDYTSLTSKYSVAIACELSDMTFYPEENPPDPEGDFECLRANAIFADAVSCAMIGYDDNPRHPEILDFATVMDTQYIDRLGFTWRSGRLRVRLSKDVPRIATELAKKSIFKLLDAHKLYPQDIAYWIFHPPGAIVLDMLQGELNLSNQYMYYSREALRRCGNCSSATVGIVGSILMETEKNPRGYGVMVNVGPGMTSNSTLLSFGG